MNVSRTCGHATYPALSLAQQREQFTSMNKVHDHIQIHCILERSPEVDDERMGYG